MNSDTYITNYLAGGGQAVFKVDGTAEHSSGRRLGGFTHSGGSSAVSSGGGTAIHSSTGSQNHYGSLWTNPQGRQYAFLSQRLDRYGRTVNYEWETQGSGGAEKARLKEVVDRDGRICPLGYTNTAFPHLITSVGDPYGHAAYFIYDTNGVLNKVIDMAGLESSFSYAQTNIMVSLHTLYGDTSFDYFDSTNPPAGGGLTNRAVKITEPTGAHQLYAYRGGGSVTNGSVVTLVSGQFAVSDAQYFDRNSYHWNRAQFATLSSSDYLNLAAVDYWKASLKHWPLQQLLGLVLLADAPTAEAGPVLHPDVSDTRSLQVFYEYQGQTSGTDAGTLRRVTKLVRNGISYSQGISTETDIGRNDWGRPTSVTHYINGNPATYGNSLDAEGRNLLGVTGPRNEAVRGYGYHPVITKLLTSVTNALNEVIRYTHDTNGMKVTSVTYPGGLVTTNLYYTSGSSAGFMAQTIDLGFRTNSYGYINGNVSIQTNELGLVTINTWDALNRQTSTRFPDGTYTSNLWEKLDLIGTRDRLGQWTRYQFNAVRQLMAMTSANGAATEYQYCGCGAPSQITVWNGSTPLVTQLSYNLAGQLITATYPDTYQLTYTYDDLGRTANVVDSGGHEVALSYNEFDQLTSVKVGSGATQRNWELRDYDEYGRLISTIDRNGVNTTNSYDFLDRVLERRTIGALGQNLTGLEVFEHNARGLTNYTDSLGKVTTYQRDALARMLYEFNANQERLGFTYNPAGQLLTLTDGKTNTTRWNYDAEGRATNKVDAANAEMFRYQYDPAGRLTNRWQAGNVATAYKFDAVGNLTNVAYAGGPVTTSPISLRYDALNRLINLQDGIGTTAYTWTGGNQLASEDGPWADDTASSTYTARLRTALTVLSPNSQLPSAYAYAYDEYRRLTNVTSAAGMFGYEYNVGQSVSAGSLIAKLTLPGHSTIENEQDDLGRLLNTVLKDHQQSTLNSHAYTYNAGNQRTKQTFTAGNYADYTYDDIGQLKTANGFEANTTTRLHEQFGYAYDKAWNLSQRTNNALVQTFNVNTANELTTSTRANTYTVAGNTTTTPTSVTVKDNANTAVPAAVYGDNTFARGSVTLLNGNNTFTAVAENGNGLKDTNVITAYLPTPISFTYDARGNLTSDGRRTFYYDAENQLTMVQVGSESLSQFAYDGLLRRRIRKVFERQNNQWVQTNEVRYVYDGNLVVQERDANNKPLVNYTRGNDLSGTIEGAGGIGGLLARSVASTVNPRHAYYHADGNGNITALVNTNGLLAAKYHYDPYGNLLAMSGPLAAANTYRFSSKEHDANLELDYYLYRYYVSSLHRWPNRDPIKETGGINMYQFVNGAPVNWADPWGEKCYWNPFDGETWAHWFGGDNKSSPPDPNSNQGLREQEGCGTGTLVGGVTGGKAAAMVGGAAAAAACSMAADGLGNLGKGERLGADAMKARRAGQSAKEAAKDIPSWALGERPFVNENGKNFAT